MTSAFQGLYISTGFYAMDDSRMEACRLLTLPAGDSGACIYTNIVRFLGDQRIMEFYEKEIRESQVILI